LKTDNYATPKNKGGGAIAIGLAIILAATVSQYYGLPGLDAEGMKAIAWFYFVLKAFGLVVVVLGITGKI